MPDCRSARRAGPSIAWSARARQHESRGVFPAVGALGAAHGRCGDRRRDDRRAPRPLRARPHGGDGGEHRREVRLHARSAGPVFDRVAPPRGTGDGERPLQEPDRADRVADEEGRRVFRHRRARAQGCQDGGSGEAEDGVQEGRYRHRRQRLGHQRRGRSSRADGSPDCKKNEFKNIGAAGRLRACRRRAPDDGARTDSRCEARLRKDRPQALRHRRRRIERSVRSAGDGSDQGSRPRSGQGQSERRRGGARPSNRRDRGDPDGEGALRARAHEQALCSGDHVHRRRAGHRRDLRKNLGNLLAAFIMRRKPRIGLALGSGSARGWAHIGAIRALEERGVKPDLVCGTSIGALVGAFYASGELDRLENWVTGLAWTTVVRLMDLSWRGGLIRVTRLFTLFRTIFEDRDIAELPVPYGAIATELASGREIWLREGKVLDAVRASCAMPGLFTPVVRGAAVLVDGGLVNPVPVSMCRALGADLVIAVDLSWGKLGPYRARGRDREVAPREVPGWLERLRPGWVQGKVKQQEASVPSIFNVFMTSLDIVEMRVARSRLAGDPADVLLTPLLPDFATMDFHRAKEAIQEGRAAVERMSPLIEQVIG